MDTEWRRQYASSAETPIDEVDITNDFMFSYVMRDPEICTRMLEYLLPDRRIHHIEYIDLDGRVAPAGAQMDTQKTLAEAFNKRGVRLDAYLDDGETVYNIEMQTAAQAALVKRARLYQAHIDINQLDRGQNFDQLKPSYVIFICKFDPFGRGLYRYTFRNVCAETTLELNDETYKVFFNTSAGGGAATGSLRELLTYMNDTRAYAVSETSDALIRRIDQAVGVAKRDDEWRRAYMTYQAHLREAELRGEERGIAIGEKRGEKKGIAIGEERVARRFAETLLRRDFTEADVAELTGLPIEEVKKLKSGLLSAPDPS